MIHNAFVLSALFTQSTFAQSGAQDSYTAGVIGGASIAGLLLLLWIYRVVMATVRKLKPVAARVVEHSSRYYGQLQSKASVLARSCVSETLQKAETPADKCWSEALSEFQGSDRRAGLWAKVFSESAGNENVATAEYLRVRAHELHAAETIAREQLLLKTVSQRAAAAYAQLSSRGRHSETQIIAVCEAHLIALGFEIRKPKPDKWEIFGTGGTTFAYSAEDLQKTTEALARHNKKG